MPVLCVTDSGGPPFVWPGTAVLWCRGHAGGLVGGALTCFLLGPLYVSSACTMLRFSSSEDVKLQMIGDPVAEANAMEHTFLLQVKDGKYLRDRPPLPLLADPPRTIK